MSSSAGRAAYLLGLLDGPIQARLKTLEQEAWPQRVFAGDAALWGSDEGLAGRLGWLTAAEDAQAHLPGLRDFAERAHSDGFTHAVVLAMGGAALAPACLQQAFGQRPDHLRTLVLDQTTPADIRALEAELPLPQTLFLVASQSGHTLESGAFHAYFEQRLGGRAGARQFCAITQEGSSLAARAKANGFREIFLTPASIGDRYTALSLFGLVPAALGGADLEALLGRAREMSRLARLPAAAENPGLRLGAILGEACLAGHDKLTLIVNDKLAAFGAWVEQLVAESTGKSGKGIVPVDGEPLALGDSYADDRLFVGILLGDHDPLEPRLRALAGPSRPVVIFKLRDTLDLGAELFRWQFGTAVAGAVLGVNPFDEPNVGDSKRHTLRLLGEAPLPEGQTFASALRAVGPAGELQSAAVELKKWVESARRGDYLSLEAYLPETPSVVAGLRELRVSLRDKTKRATTLGFGPRCLHATGQLHKGGPDTGLFLQLTGTPDAVGGELPIPGAGYGFGRLIAAQAAGDREALRGKGRRLLHLELSDARAGLRELSKALS